LSCNALRISSVNLDLFYEKMRTLRHSLFSDFVHMFFLYEDRVS